MKRPRLFIALWIAVAALLAILPAVRDGKVIGAYDQLRPSLGSQEVPVQAWDILQADGVLQFYSWRDLVFEAHRKGELPALNPYQLAGQPLLANSQSGGLYPPHVVLGKLGVPTPAGINLLAWFHLFWAGLGVALLVRKLSPEEASPIWATAAGISFGLSAFMLSWLGLPSVPSTVAWIPWLGLGVVSLKNGKELKPRLFATAGIAACTGMMLLAGHLQFSAYGLMAAFVLLLWAAIDERCIVRFGLGLVAFALGAGLAMPQLGPTLEFSKLSHRRNVPTEEGFAAYQGGALTPLDLGGVLAPKLFGDPTVAVPEANGLSTYWPPLVKRGGNFAESALALGPLVLGFLFLLRRQSLRAAFPGILVGVLGLLLAFGSPLGRLLYFSFPGWSSTGSPGRAIVLFVLGACVVAGVAAGQIWDREEWARRRVGVLGGMLAVLAACVLTARLAPSRLSSWIPGSDEVLAAVVAAGRPDAILLAVVGCALALAALLARDKVEDPRLANALVPLVALVLPILLLPSLRSGTPLQADLGKPEGRVAIINDPWDLLTRAPSFLPPNLASQLRIMELAGYDSLLNRDQVAMLNEINGLDSAPAANGNIMFVKPSADPAKLAEAGVTEVWTRFRLTEDFGEPSEQRESFLVYKLDGPGLISTDQGSARLASLGTERIVLELEGDPADVTLRIWRHDGWTSNVPMADDPPWIRLSPPPGTSQVVLTYTPPGFETGTRIGAICLCVVAVLTIWAWPRRAT